MIWRLHLLRSGKTHKHLSAGSHIVSSPSPCCVRQSTKKLKRFYGQNGTTVAKRPLPVEHERATACPCYPGGGVPNRPARRGVNQRPPPRRMSSRDEVSQDRPRIPTDAGAVARVCPPAGWQHLSIGNADERRADEPRQPPQRCRYRYPQEWRGVERFCRNSVNCPVALGRLQ